MLQVALAYSVSELRSQGQSWQISLALGAARFGLTTPK
jgi:hypothetical protein